MTSTQNFSPSDVLPDPGAPSGRRGLNIVHVWDADYPWDVRAEKVSRALTDAGHAVHMVARNTQGLALVEHRPEATIHRLAPVPGVPGSVSRASMFPAFFNPRWITAIERVARANGADLILCRDLPLAPAAIYVAGRLGIPMVLDMAENYPEMLRSRWSTGRMGLTDIFVRNPTAARYVERWTLPRSDAVMVVVEESGDRIVREGIRRERVAVVGNTPPLARLEKGVATHSAGPLEVVYLGLLELQRGLGTLIDAFALLDREGFPARLTLYGDGVDAEVLRQQSDRLALTGRTVVFRGRVQNHIALQELPRAHVGVIPHWKDGSWDTTIPNKLFDYMAAGLVVVTSNCIPPTRVVRTTGCGRVYQDRDPGDLAATLRALKDPEVRRVAAERGREAIRTTYHWENDVKRMLDLVENVVSSRR